MGDEHKLHAYLQGLIQSLVAEKPSNPYRYMIEQLQVADTTAHGDTESNLTSAPAITNASASSVADSRQALELAKKQTRMNIRFMPSVCTWAQWNKPKGAV